VESLQEGLFYYYVRDAVPPDSKKLKTQILAVSSIFLTEGLSPTIGHSDQRAGSVYVRFCPLWRIVEHPRHVHLFYDLIIESIE